MNELTFNEKLTAFAFLLEYEQLEGLKLHDVDCEPNREHCKTTIKMGNTWARVDVGMSGKYMVALKDIPGKGQKVGMITLPDPDKDVKQGDIVFIKNYGTPNLLKKHRHGNLDTIHEYNWTNYEAGFIGAEGARCARLPLILAK